MAVMRRLSRTAYLQQYSLPFTNRPVLGIARNRPVGVFQPVDGCKPVGAGRLKFGGIQALPVCVAAYVAVYVAVCVAGYVTEYAVVKLGCVLWTVYQGCTAVPDFVQTAGRIDMHRLLSSYD